MLPRPLGSGEVTMAPESSARMSMTARGRSTGRRGCAGRHQAAHRASELHRVAARIEVESIDEKRMNDGRTQGQVKQRRHFDPVEQEPRVAGIRAANRVERQRPHQSRDTGQRLDHAEGIACRSRCRRGLLARNGQGCAVTTVS
jgi:hypothetical protein